jgi:CheY-like chemotaxis protein
MTEQRHIRILVVEDNPQDVFLLRAALPGAGLQNVELVHTERLADALQIVRQDVMDVILTDLNLPDSMGLETVRALARQADNTPVLVLTGESNPELQRELLQNGASAQVSKDLLHTPIFAEIIQTVLGS